MNSDFEEFCSHAELIKLTSVKLNKLQNVDFSFRMLKIEKCNADKGNCFSQAHCETCTNMRTSQLVGDRLVKTLDAYRLPTIYERGIHLLTDFLSDHSTIPVGIGEKMALQRLLHTLLNLDSIKNCLKQAFPKNEFDWTLALTQHLLRSLAVNQSYRVAEHYETSCESCSCCQQDISGKFGDTSIGCTNIWHGFIDLILGSEIPVFTAYNEESVKGVEVKSLSEFSKHREQIIAQTIVFSFLQKKENSSYENYLIPCLGIAKNHVIVFMYDCEQDILLESAQMKLLSATGDDILVTGVLALWLVINYRFTCSGVTQHMIDTEFKADFAKHAGKKFETYQKYVEYGCGQENNSKDFFIPDEIDYINLY